MRRVHIVLLLFVLFAGVIIPAQAQNRWTNCRFFALTSVQPNSAIVLEIDGITYTTYSGDKTWADFGLPPLNYQNTPVHIWYTLPNGDPAEDSFNATVDCRDQPPWQGEVNTPEGPMLLSLPCGTIPLTLLFSLGILRELLRRYLRR